MPKVLTNEEAIARAVESGESRGHKFIGFSGGKYKNQKTECIFSCVKHGEFRISHDRAIRCNCPCPLCNTKRNRTKEEVEVIVNKRALELGLKFIGFTDEYKNKKSRIILNCSEHGDFDCSITNFINKGSGCWYCGGTKPISESMAIRIINKKCEEKGVKFVGIIGNPYPVTKMQIMLNCDMHGDYQTNYSDHVYDSCSCPRCNGNGVDMSDFYVSEVNRIHKGSVISIIRNKQERLKYKQFVTMKCKEHGEWIARLHNILSGNGCPFCAGHGFSQLKRGTLYMLRSECGQHVKIGISNDHERRILALIRDTPFRFDVIELYHNEDGKEIARLEKEFHRKYESAGFSGFDGATEWLKFSPELLEEFRSLSR